VTEAGWLAATGPRPMLDEGGRLTDRKARLFTAACSRAAWHLLPHKVSQGAVAIPELVAHQVDRPRA
jgi:hypothetical protein